MIDQTTADIIEVLNRFAKPDLKEGGYTLHDSDFDKVANSLVEPVEDERCEWRYDEHCDMWEGDCGIAWAMIEGTPIENDMMYCPKCGKKLLDTPYDPEDK